MAHRREKWKLWAGLALAGACTLGAGAIASTNRATRLRIPPAPMPPLPSPPPMLPAPAQVTGPPENPYPALATLAVKSLAPGGPIAREQLPELAVPLSLPNALRLAFLANLDIRQSDEVLNQARAALMRANVAWVPKLNLGAPTAITKATIQKTEGNIIKANRDSLFLGGGPSITLQFSEAVFAPLAGSALDGCDQGRGLCVWATTPCSRSPMPISMYCGPAGGWHGSTRRSNI